MKHRFAAAAALSLAALLAACDKVITPPSQFLASPMKMNSAALKLSWVGGYAGTPEEKIPLSTVGAWTDLRFSDHAPEGDEVEQLLAWYDAAWILPTLPPEGEPGSPVEMLLEDDRIKGGTTYYFVIVARTGTEPDQMTIDLATATGIATPPVDAAPPGAIEDVVVVDATNQGMTPRIAWTAPGDDGILGQAKAYDIRYSAEDPATAPDPGAWFEAATPMTGEPAPSSPGSTNEFLIALPSFDTKFWIALCARDEAGQWGEVTAEGIVAVVTPADLGSHETDTGIDGALGGACGSTASGGPALAIVLAGTALFAFGRRRVSCHP